MPDPVPPRDPAVAELLVEMRFLRRDVELLSTKLTETEKKVSEMQALVSKYRGGLAVILGAGALIGWVLNTMSSGAKLWH